MEVALHDTDFFLRLERMQTPRAVFEAQGTTHGEVDFRLVQSIDELLIPHLGRWEESDTWFHQLDYYGDGVRSLTFSRAAFPFEHVKSLQRLLQGEHSSFCILCIATSSLGAPIDQIGSSPEDDYLAIFANGLLATKAIAARLSEASQETPAK